MPTWSVPATVESVVDGDTVHLLLDLGWHITYKVRARISGINAPEMNTAAGRDAKAYASMLLEEGGVVTFSSHSLDKYGRPLGAITDAAGADFAEAMRTAGHAVVMKE